LARYVGIVIPKVPVFYVDNQQEKTDTSVENQQERLWAPGRENRRGNIEVDGREGKSDVLQGTLDLLVLKTLETMGPMHGWGIARRLEQVSGNILQMNQGTVYPALLRLLKAGWIRAKWGVSENNRRARFYALTESGNRRLRTEEDRWGRISAVIARVLRPET
jgi:PadR family transcriptional regulator, regulatory protein PadR